MEPHLAGEEHKESRFLFLSRFNRKFFKYTPEVYAFFSFFLLLAPAEELSVQNSLVEFDWNYFYYSGDLPAVYAYSYKNFIRVLDDSMNSLCSKSTINGESGHRINRTSTPDCEWTAEVSPYIYGIGMPVVAGYIVQSRAEAVTCGTNSWNLTCDYDDVVCGKFNVDRQLCVDTSSGRQLLSVVYGTVMVALLPAVMWTSRTRDFLAYPIICVWGILAIAYDIDRSTCDGYDLYTVGIIAVAFSSCMLLIKTVIIVVIACCGLPLVDKKDGD
jgi:hypothetical protein